MAVTAEKIKKIKLICLDVDGVLTDGGIIIGSDKTEYKKFDVKDGTGIALARHAGYEFAIISGRHSAVIAHRALELKIEHVYQDVKYKMDAYEDLKKKTGYKDEQICFVGDEIIDVPVMEKCGFSCAPADSAAEALAAADYVCVKKGGCGAVREVCELIMNKSGLKAKAVKRYLGK